MFDLAQTFYVDEKAVANSDTIAITSVELYFISKPSELKTKTGIDSPGVSLYIVPVDTNGPQTNSVFHTEGSRVEFSNILTSPTGVTATKFTFRNPVNCATGSMYAFCVHFDGSDPDFKLWYNKAGELKLGTTTKTQVSSGKADGNLYKITNGSVLTPERDADLKFKINIAKFTSLSQTFTITNRNYEILGINTSNGNFFGGEPVWQIRANNTGTVSVSNTTTNVVGTGTSFSSLYTVGDAFVLTDGSFINADVRTIASITNNTLLSVNLAPKFTNTAAQHIKTVTAKVYVTDGITDHLVLSDSTSNSSVFLTTSSIMVGIDSRATANISSIKDYRVNSLMPGFAIVIPSGTNISLSSNFANSGHVFSNSSAFSSTLGKRDLVTSFDAVLSSRTTEVTTGTPYKSYKGSMTFTTTNRYVSPYVREENLDMFLERFVINNDTTNENITGIGNAHSKYISKSITLVDGQHAEDMRVYVSAWQPANTSVLLYAKVLNQNDPESFDLKNWSLMTQITPNAISNRNNTQNYVEIQYGMPSIKPGVLANGTFTVNSSAIIAGTSGTVNSTITIGSLVRVYSPSLSSTYFYDTVTAANSSTFTVATNQTANASLQQSGMLVDVITDKNGAFLNNQNQNVVRYMNKAGSFYDAYDTFCVKVVMLSSDATLIPFLDDLRVIAVTA